MKYQRLHLGGLRGMCHRIRVGQVEHSKTFKGGEKRKKLKTGWRKRRTGSRESSASASSLDIETEAPKGGTKGRFHKGEGCPIS